MAYVAHRARFAGWQPQYLANMVTLAGHVTITIT
jgi:hypothetical protein